MCTSDILKIAGGLLTPVIALIATYIAWQQWKTTRHKLRFDLYSRRFAVYESTLVFYQALMGGRASTKSNTFPEIQNAFIKSYRESQFLFKPGSGIFKLLEEVNSESMVIIGLHSNGAALVGTPQLLIDMNQKAGEAQEFIGRSLKKLEIKIAPYLNFHNVLA